MHAQAHHNKFGATKLEESGSSSEFVTRTMRKVIDEETAKLENGLTVLASVGSTAPFVGLFGTVWGVYHALVGIGLSDGVTINRIAGPVGEALIMTGLGLAVAIPAVLAYNTFVRNNRVFLSRLDAFAHDLFAFLTTGQQVALSDGKVRALRRQSGGAQRGANKWPLAASRARGGSSTVSEINMVPLIDVMLVLLVIFIITAPLLAHSIKINMPQVAAEQIEEEPKTVDLAIDASGALFWDEKPVNIDDLPNRFKALAGDKPQPEIRIRADQNTRYETLAKVMASARRSGMTRIGFVTTPPSGGNGQGGAAEQGGALAPAPAR